MARSGMFLHGKELLEQDLHKLSDIERLESKIETIAFSRAPIFSPVPQNKSPEICQLSVKERLKNRIINFVKKL